MRTLIVIGVVVIGALVSCKQGYTPPHEALVPPSAAEADAFAKTFAAAMSPCKPEAIVRVIDVNRLITRAGMPELVRIESAAKGALLCNALSDHTYTFLRIQMEGASPRPLFRILSVGSSVNYAQLELDKSSGELRVRDIFDFRQGARLSEILREIFELSKEGVKSRFVRDTLQQIKTEIAAKNFTRAERLFKVLPDTIRTAKPGMMMALVIAEGLGPDVYAATIDAYAKAFPADPALEILQLDGAQLRKEHANLHAMIDRLDQKLGGDPYLDALRADAYIQEGNLVEATRRAQRAISAEPTLQAAWWALATAQSANKDFAGALATLEHLRDEFGVALDDADISGDDRFSALAASQEYQTWRTAAGASVPAASDLPSRDR